MAREAKAQNRMDLRAELYNAEADSRAQRISDSWDAVPAESKVLDSKDLHAMWHFTQSQNPEQDFWQIHDQALQQTLAANPNPQPEDVQKAYQQAEQAALQQVYPYRMRAANIDGLEPQAAVDRANRAYQLVQRVEQGGPGQ